jgi:hypothetical protein
VIDLTYWYLLPISIVIAAIANGAGIGGATFFSPLFVLGLGLSPQVAIGTALITEVFGFASGVSAHARARTIDWGMARALAVASVPLAVVGSLLAGLANPDLLKIILGVGLIGIAVAFLRHPDEEAEDAAIGRGEGVVEPNEQHTITARDGTV